jgi:hypothetical protein
MLQLQLLGRLLWMCLCFVTSAVHGVNSILWRGSESLSACLLSKELGSSCPHVSAAAVAVRVQYKHYLILHCSLHAPKMYHMVLSA